MLEAAYNITNIILSCNHKKALEKSSGGKNYNNKNLLEKVQQQKNKGKLKSKK